MRASRIRSSAMGSVVMFRLDSVFYFLSLSIQASPNDSCLRRLLKYRFRLDPVISPSVCSEFEILMSSLFDPGATGLLSLSIHHSNAPI